MVLNVALKFYTPSSTLAGGKIFSLCEKWLKLYLVIYRTTTATVQMSVEWG